jgi:hypothetical protein
MGGNETDAQIASAPPELNVVATAPRNIRFRRARAFVQEYPVFAPLEF